MAKTDPTTKLPDTNPLVELEQANASLAARVGELTADLEAREAALAAANARAEQLGRDLEGGRFRVREVESKLTAVEGQRDEVAVLLRERDEDLGSATREIERLREHMRHRSAGAPLSLDIAALLDLHRILGGERYLVTARRLGDALVAQHEPDASDPS